jgi:hypothetical protein
MIIDVFYGQQLVDEVRFSWISDGNVAHFSSLEHLFFDGDLHPFRFWSVTAGNANFVYPWVMHQGSPDYSEGDRAIFAC